MKLPKDDADLFYRLHWSLMFHANQKYKVFKGLKTPDFKNKDEKKVVELHNKLYSHLELIDSFVTENPFKFNQEELDIIKSWKNCIKDRFIVLSHTKNYTVFLKSEKEPKAYGVLGLYDEIKDIMSPYLPTIAETVLLPFKGRIIYCGFIHSYKIQFGAGIRKTVQEDYEKAKSRFGIILSLDAPVCEKNPGQNEDLEDLIASETMLDWDLIKNVLPEMPTGELIKTMVELGLYVNKTLALEIAKRENAVFHLRKLIQDGNHWYIGGPGDTWSPVHAIHILPLIKSREALGLLLDTIRYRGEDLDAWLTENVPSLLVAFGEDAIEQLKEFSCDETLEMFSRGAAVTALAALAKKFPFQQDDIKKHMAKLLGTTLNPEFAGLVADDLASFHDSSVLPEIHRAFEEGKIDKSISSEDDINSIVEGSYDDADEIEFKMHTDDPLKHFSRENIEHLHYVYCEDEVDSEEDFSWLDDEVEPDVEDFEINDDNIEPEVKKAMSKKEKTGRNDPCPCGSGKKYKKCCMGKE